MIDITVLFPGGSFFSGIKDVVLSVAAVMTAIAAFRGLNTWQEQKKDERFHTNANRAWQAWYELTGSLQGLYETYKVLVGVYTAIHLEKAAEVSTERHIMITERLGNALHMFYEQKSNWDRVIWETDLDLQGIREQLVPLGEKFAGQFTHWLSKVQSIQLRGYSVDASVNRTILELGFQLKYEGPYVTSTQGVWEIPSMNSVYDESKTLESSVEEMSAQVRKILEDFRPPRTRGFFRLTGSSQNPEHTSQP